MNSYLLLCGLIILVLLASGIFFTVKEFYEMADHPDDYRRTKDKINLDQ